MAKWSSKRGVEILQVSSKIEDSLKELQDCLEKKKLEIGKLHNIDQVLAMTSAFQPKRAETLMEDRKRVLERLKMLNRALEVLQSQIGNA